MEVDVSITAEEELSAMVSLAWEKHRGWIEYRRLAKRLPLRRAQFLEFAEQDRKSAKWWIKHAKWRRERLAQIKRERELGEAA